MNAPPISNINEINLSNIKCSEPFHKNNPIVGICIDPKCTNNNKFMCLDCIFDKHSTHKGIKSQEIEELFKKNFEQYKNTNELIQEKKKK